MATTTTCSVIYAGPANDGNVNIRLVELTPNTNFGGEPRWFCAKLDIKREILATALTAITTELYVWVELDKVDKTAPPGNSCGTILTMYVMRG